VTPEDLPDIMTMLCNSNPLARLAGLHSLEYVIINEKKNLPGNFFDNRDFFQALIANMIGEKNAILQYNYCDIIGVIIRSTRGQMLSNLVTECMLPQALVNTMIEAGRRSNSHALNMKVVADTYVETIIACIWSAACLCEQNFV
jgi:hypothetical protein